MSTTGAVTSAAALTKISARVHVTTSDGVALLTLDNRGQRNALTPHMCRELVHVCEAVGRDPEVAVVVLRGAGGDFSAGVAIDRMDELLFTAEDGALPAPGKELFSRADAALRALPQPLVAVVEGVCMGGGWQVAATADYVLASDTVRIAITPGKLGVLYPRPGLERLVDRVGPMRAKRLLLTGEELSPADAEGWGLVSELVPAADLEGRLADLIATLRSRSAYSAEHHLRLVDGFTAGSPAYTEDWERAWAGTLTSGDLAEGRNAFLEKRRPHFTWRR